MFDALNVCSSPVFFCAVQRLQSWKDRRKKQSQQFSADFVVGGQKDDTPLDQIQDPAERVAAFRRVRTWANA